MQRAIELAETGMTSGAGGPFGVVVVKNGEIIAEGYNRVLIDHDPTAHAEIVAIREACKALESFQLEDCIIYTSCEPCPMCAGAIYWARPKKVYYACTRADAAKLDFDDDHIFEELSKDIDARQIPFIPMMRENALPVFEAWMRKEDKERY